MIDIRQVWVVTGVSGGAMPTHDIIAVCTTNQKAQEIKKKYNGYADITKRKAAVNSWGAEREALTVYLIDEFENDPLQCDLDIPDHQNQLKKEALAKLTPAQIEALKELGLD